MKKERIGIGIIVSIGIIAALTLGMSEKRLSGSVRADHHGHSHGSDAHGHDHASDKGPNGGKVLVEGPFELEVVIVEHGGRAHFRAYPSHNHKALDPRDVKVSIELERLGDKVTRVDFKPASGFLYSEQEINEPHSFLLKVFAEWKGEKFDWEYTQYEGRLTLPTELAKRMGIESATAGPGTISSVLELPGEIAFDPDRVSHVVARVPGVVHKGLKNLGDEVKQGEVIAAIDSRELGEARSRYLAALEREKLVRYNFDRLERLWDKQAIAEKEFITAQKNLKEETILRVTAARKLMTMGLTANEIKALTDGALDDLTLCTLLAPLDGTVIKKHLSPGEWVKEDAELYVIADTSKVWAHITVYPKDLSHVRIGQRATIISESSGAETLGVVSYVGPQVAEESRTATARIEIPNPDGLWRPGLFVKVRLVREEVAVPMTVQSDAIQWLGKKAGVFAQFDDQYEWQPLKLGRKDGRFTEVLAGLSPGDHYVVRNSYILKSELGKSRMSHEH